MKINTRPSNLLAQSVLLVTAMCSGLFAQNQPLGSEATDQKSASDRDTNEITAAIADLQKQLVQPQATPSPVFVNAPDAAARLSAADRTRQTALAARQNVQEEIEFLSVGAVARFGPHQVLFPPSMPDVLELRTPDGLRLRSRVIGLCYLSDSGKSVMLAELKDSVGELVYPKTVIYRDAFDDVSADIVYEYTHSSFEQTVVIRKQLPAPSEFGFSEGENVRLVVLTEFLNPPQPRRVPKSVSLREQYQALGMERDETLTDEMLSFGAMRMVAGKSFTLGEPQRSVPSGKTWEVLVGPQGERRQFLIEATPYRLIKPQLDVLPVRTALHSPREPQNIMTALLQLKVPPARKRPPLMAKAQTAVEAEPGVILDYLIVNTPLLNVEFVYTGKYGIAAFGYDPSDYWNAYDFQGYNVGWLTNLYWSDSSQSSVGITVSNSPGVGYNTVCAEPVDPMYAYFMYPSNGGHITVTITNLPADEYDLVVYATRASETGAPKIELKRNGTSLWTKNTTQWGNGWYSTFWEEGEQFVRFRNITVTNQTLVLDSYPDAAGYASLSGLQIIPSDAVPAYQPGISNLLNVNFGTSTASDKVGPAVVGLATNDYWNPYGYNGAYAVSVTNLLWSNQGTSTVGIVVWNSPGTYGSPGAFDPVIRSWKYAWNGGNTTAILTNLPSANCDVYLYTPQTEAGHNSMYELWSDGVDQGIKGTTLGGYNYLTTTNWEFGIQYVLFKDVTVSSNQPVVIHVKHSSDGYQYISGLQIAYKGAVDTDGDGLPDAWEMKWFGNLDQPAEGDPDSDGLTNLREYRLGLDPLRYDSDADGIADGMDAEIAWLEDASPQGCYQYTAGGDTWNWVTSWSDGVGWNGSTLYPYSGQKLCVSANTTNTMHQHYFERAVSVLRPGTGDVLYAYVNLDPTKPPTEVMLQFYTMENNGYTSWERRAYWGANLISGGTDGTASRTNMGALPTTGQWVRLQVPASAVGLEGRIIEGMAFTLYSGRAAWDRAGVFNPDLGGDGSFDLDGDGLPDSWEAQHFGNLNQTGSGDYDSDGLTNWQEYTLGTNPTSAAAADSNNVIHLQVFTPLK